MNYTDGRRYEGNWNSNKEHGQASMFFTDNKVRIGIWKYGVHIEWLSPDDVKIIEPSSPYE